MDGSSLVLPLACQPRRRLWNDNCNFQQGEEGDQATGQPPHADLKYGQDPQL